MPSNVQKISAENSSSGCVKSDSRSCLGLCLAVIFIVHLRSIMVDWDITSHVRWLKNKTVYLTSYYFYAVLTLLTGFCHGVFKKFYNTELPAALYLALKTYDLELMICSFRLLPSLRETYVDLFDFLHHYDHVKCYREHNLSHHLLCFSSKHAAQSSTVYAQFCCIAFTTSLFHSHGLTRVETLNLESECKHIDFYLFPQAQFFKSSQFLQTLLCQSEKRLVIAANSIMCNKYCSRNLIRNLCYCPNSWYLNNS